MKKALLLLFILTFNNIFSLFSEKFVQVPFFNKVSIYAYEFRSQVRKIYFYLENPERLTEKEKEEARRLLLLGKKIIGGISAIAFTGSVAYYLMKKQGLLDVSDNKIGGLPHKSRTQNRLNIPEKIVLNTEPNQGLNTQIALAYRFAGMKAQGNSLMRNAALKRYINHLPFLKEVIGLTDSDPVAFNLKPKIQLQENLIDSASGIPIFSDNIYFHQLNYFNSRRDSDTKRILSSIDISSIVSTLQYYDKTVVKILEERNNNPIATITSDGAYVRIISIDDARAPEELKNTLKLMDGLPFRSSLPKEFSYDVGHDDRFPMLIARNVENRAVEQAEIEILEKLRNIAKTYRSLNKLVGNDMAAEVIKKAYKGNIPYLGGFGENA